MRKGIAIIILVFIQGLGFSQDKEMTWNEFNFSNEKVEIEKRILKNNKNVSGKDLAFVYFIRVSFDFQIRDSSERKKKPLESRYIYYFQAKRNFLIFKKYYLKCHVHIYDKKSGDFLGEVRSDNNWKIVHGSFFGINELSKDMLTKGITVGYIYNSGSHGNFSFVLVNDSGVDCIYVRRNYSNEFDFINLDVFLDKNRDQFNKMLGELWIYSG